MKDHVPIDNGRAKINVLYSGFTFVDTFNRNTHCVGTTVFVGRLN